MTCNVAIVRASLEYVRSYQRPIDASITTHGTRLPDTNTRARCCGKSFGGGIEKEKKNRPINFVVSYYSREFFSLFLSSLMNNRCLVNSRGRLRDSSS